MRLDTLGLLSGQEREFSCAKAELEGRLQHIERELNEARREVDVLRGQVEGREEEGMAEKERLERERTRTQALMKVSQ